MRVRRLLDNDRIVFLMPPFGGIGDQAAVIFKHGVFGRQTGPLLWLAIWAMDSMELVF